MFNFIQKFLTEIGVNGTMLKPLSSILLVICICLGLWLLYKILSRLIEPIITRITARTAIKWDDIIFRHKALRWLWILIVGIIALYLVPAALTPFPAFQSAAVVFVRVVLILTMMMLVIESMKSVFLLIADHDNIDEIAEQMRIAKENGEEFVYHPSHSLKGLQQMLVIIIVGGAAILIISTLLGKDPLIIFSGLGAAAAVLMLIFQDSILGVVAGIQLTANDMLRPGDWIAVPKYEANGIVKEVTLATVKIQNWDKTITTIPPYKLISEGFQNWRGMQDSHGRRVARSIIIDINSIRKATDEEASQWRAQHWGKDLPDGQFSNLSAFRRYLEHYITTIPTFVPSMLYMVRELQPNQYGLPIEIYFFTSCIEWKKYEHVQADVIDHVLTILADFGLRAYTLNLK